MSFIGAGPQSLDEKYKDFFLAIYFEILPKFSDFKGLEINKKQIFYGAKIRNPGNCIYDYTKSFFKEDF